MEIVEMIRVIKMEIVEMIETHKEELQKSLKIQWFNSVEKKDLNTMEALLNQDPSLLNFQDDTSRKTALNIAVDRFSLEMTQFLLEKDGINTAINDRDSNGRSWYYVMDYNFDDTTDELNNLYKIQKQICLHEKWDDMIKGLDDAIHQRLYDKKSTMPEDEYNDIIKHEKSKNKWFTFKLFSQWLNALKERDLIALDKLIDENGYNIVKHPCFTYEVFDVIKVQYYDYKARKELIKSQSEIEADTELVLHLISKKVLILNACDRCRSGESLYRMIEFAVCARNNEIVESLVKNGADLNPLFGQKGAIHIAAENNDTTSIQHLLNGVLDINLPYGNYNTTALHIACEKGHKEAVKFLLDKQARIDIFGSLFSCTPIGIAISKYAELTKSSELKSNLVKTINAELTELFERKSNSVEIANAELGLFEQKSNLVTTINAELTELSKRRSDLLEIITLLARNPDDLKCIASEYGRSRYTPLMLSIKLECLDIADFFLQQGDELNRPENTCNFANLLCQNEKIANYLLGHKIDINIQDKEGNTALHRAASNHNFTIIKFLLEEGADPDKKNNENKTPIDILNKILVSEEKRFKRFENRLERSLEERIEKIKTKARSKKVTQEIIEKKAKDRIKYEDKKQNGKVNMDISRDKINACISLLKDASMKRQPATIIEQSDLEIGEQVMEL